MIIAILLLLLGLFGIIPMYAAAPLALGSLAIGIVGGFQLTRKLRAIRPANGLDAMVGEVAPAVTNIGPDGTVRYKNELWNARTSGPTIQSGETVRIVGAKGLRLIVERSDA